MKHIAIMLALCILTASLPAQGVNLPGDFQKAYITGTVTFAGKPLPGARVIAMGKDGSAFATSADNGNYSLGVGAGDWKVVAAKKGFITAPAVSVQVGAEQSQDGINFDLKKPDAVIEGTVVNESNAPLSSAHVFVISKETMDDMFQGKGEGQASLASMFSSGLPENQTDKYGRFTLHVASGDYILNAARAGYRLSPKTPNPYAPAIPGMGSVPYLKNLHIPPMGTLVSVAPNGIRKGVVIVMQSAPVYQPKQENYTYQEPKPEKKIPAKVDVLVGKASLTPNNVLHWTRTQHDDSETPFFTVVRTTRPVAAGGKIPEAKTFRFPIYWFGSPSGGYYSFTDSTAKPGTTYYYYVYETGSDGAGPYSNPVRLTTL